MDEIDPEDDDDEPLVAPEEDPVGSTGKCVYQQPFTDMLISAEVSFTLEGEVRKEKVKGR